MNRKSIDMKVLERLYCKENHTLKECAEILGVCDDTIAARLGDKVRPAGKHKGERSSVKARKNMSVAQLKAKKDYFQPNVPEGMRRCSSCKTILPIDMFGIKNRRGKVGYQHACKSCTKVMHAKSRAKHIESRRNKGREYAMAHKEENRIRNKERGLRLKIECFKAYGGCRCACCGVEHLIFLTIDHINGGGSKHRKRLTNNIYKVLKDQGYPPGYRVLCFNCNWAEYNGGCPHGVE